MGFGVSALLRFGYGVGERASLYECSGDESEGSREAADDAVDAIARFLKLGDRVEYRHARAGGRFLSNGQAALARCFKQPVVFDLQNRERFLVFQNDVKSALQRL